MILRTIKCDLEGCNEVYTEKKENAGFPGWGHFFGGIINDFTGSDKFYLCPVCRKTVFKILLRGHRVINECYLVYCSFTEENKR